MDGVPPTGHAPPEWRSDMIDVSGMTLSELGAVPVGESAAAAVLPEGLIKDGPDPARGRLTGHDESPLARALRRIADEVTRAREPIAGFNSAL